MTATDTVFAGSIAALYDRLMVPLKFTPWAEDMARRIAALAPATILETAAGSGVVTEQIAKALPEAAITATDLNPAMLEIAARRPGLQRVHFQPADAQALPFAEASFDLVACQFGVMFYPDRVAAAREVRRVLRGGGTYLFSVWDCLDSNPVSKVLSEALAEQFPDNPPSFYARVPFGYHDTARIAADLAEAGFTDITIETLKYAHGALTARDAAEGMCRGTPLAAEIATHGESALDRAIEAGTRALQSLCGADGRIDAMMSAHIITAGT
jgi:ubiquinone/menaquinone biosynthesis C-methylase UbiE